MSGPLGGGYAVASHSCARKQASERVRTARLELMSLGVRSTSHQQIHNILGVIHSCEMFQHFTVYQAKTQ